MAGLTKLPNPEDQSLKTFKHWLVHPAGGNKFLQVSPEANTWTPDKSRKDDRVDLILLANPGGEGDGFSC